MALQTGGCELSNNKDSLRTQPKLCWRNIQNKTLYYLHGPLVEFSIVFVTTSLSRFYLTILAENPFSEGFFYLVFISLLSRFYLKFISTLSQIYLVYLKCISNLSQTRIWKYLKWASLSQIYLTFTSLLCQKTSPPNRHKFDIK